MSKHLPEFDRLNAEAFSQIPTPPGAQQIHLENVAGDIQTWNPLARGAARFLLATYVTNDTPSQIHEFLTNGMLTQGWQIRGEHLKPPNWFRVRWRKGYACVIVHIRIWNRNSPAFTGGYKPSSPEETPVSWYEIHVEHSTEAVPGAPELIEDMLSICDPESE
jgi:hypothetical protein